MNRHALVALALFAGPIAAQQQPIDSAYSAQIRALTPVDPRWKFSTELVDYLPASKTVPTPLKVLGYVPGTIGRLSYVADINRYFKTLTETSPRAKWFSMGMSDEGREHIVIAISDEETIKRIDDYRGMIAKLADPRTRSAADRGRLIKTAKPIYWLTGSIHSPETGSPEMLMELGYRLAVDESETIRAIRKNVIVLITPVLEVDGRDHVVDTYKESKALGLGPYGVNLIYWGRYAVHDNNRDGMVLSQKLTQNYIKSFLYWKPTIAHDLHESVPFLYTSTGTGPYNEEFDPIVINEWYQFAYQEVNELTRRGLPGVWTYGFYDGWAPNYVLSIANLHNSMGKFYETYTSRMAECHTVNLPTAAIKREWYRASPPVNGLKWCIRTNLNYQQSGVLVALKYTADNKETLLENFATKSEHTLRKGLTGAPYAFLIPKTQRRASEAADLVNLFRMHGAEISEATADFTLAKNPGKADTGRAAQVAIKSGDWIVRMDQPYTQTVRSLLSRQSFKPDDPAPYDDTGWTLDALRHVETVAIADSAVYSKPMRMLTSDAAAPGTVVGSGSVYVVPHLGDWRSAVLPWKVKGKVTVAEADFAVGDQKFPAGTFLISGGDASAITELGLRATAVGSGPAVATHAITLPRIALVHTWRETQNEGWVRYAFDRIGVPYRYLSDQDLRQPASLDQIDVVVFPHVGYPTAMVLNGAPMIGPPIPWKKTAATPNLGVNDQTDDMRPGMGLEGAVVLRRFIERGGMLLTEGQTDELPISLGFTPTVNSTPPRNLKARGAVFRAQIVAPKSPLLYGYERATFPVFFSQTPLLTVTPADTSVSGREQRESMDPAVADLTESQRARVVLQFHEKVDSLLYSGLLFAGEELAKKAAVVDAPLGKGHIIYFAIRPFWRWQTQGSFAMAFNAIANWNSLDVDQPATKRAGDQ